MLHCTLDSTMASFAEFDASGTVSEFALSVADVGTSNHEIFRGLSEVPCSFSNATFCNRYFHVIVCHRLQHSGRPRGATSPPYFLTKLRPEGPKKKCFWRLSPPLISGSGWPPPRLTWRPGSTTATYTPTCHCNYMLSLKKKQQQQQLQRKKQNRNYFALHILDM